jgi:hypothetical protein
MTATLWHARIEDDGMGWHGYVPTVDAYATSQDDAVRIARETYAAWTRTPDAAKIARPIGDDEVETAYPLHRVVVFGPDQDHDPYHDGTCVAVREFTLGAGYIANTPADTYLAAKPRPSDEDDES